MEIREDNRVVLKRRSFTLKEVKKFARAEEICGPDKKSEEERERILLN